MEFFSNRLLFNEITWKDLHDIHMLHSYPEVDEFNTLGLPKNLNETKDLVSPMIEVQNSSQRKLYTWKICLKDKDTFIGLCGYTLSLDKFKLGEIYYKFLPSYWGNGYATETAKRLIILGFEEFKLHKVEAGVAIGNRASIHVLEKAGMTREVLRRKILPIRGEWIDNYHYAIVEDDPRAY